MTNAHIALHAKYCPKLCIHSSPLRWALVLISHMGKQKHTEGD